MKQWLLLMLCVGCGGVQHASSSSNPTCGDIVEHHYAVQSRDLRGDHAFAARREFTRVKPQMIAVCESADLTVERKRCIMAADSKADANECKRKFPGR